ncbi:hypothetical protein MMC14_001136 [Varicellaria rhodocarpa]|nr:hypothetical protein [Varicellaria rhodocarpa]
MHFKSYLTLAVAGVILSSTASPLPGMMTVSGGGDIHRDPVVHGKAPSTVKLRGPTEMETPGVVYPAINLRNPNGMEKQETPDTEKNIRDPIDMEKREAPTTEMQRDNPDGIFLDPQLTYPVFPAQKNKDG